MFGGAAPQSLKFLFTEVADVLGRHAHCDIAEANVDTPSAADHTDLAIGFPCQDVSSLNNNREHNLAVIRNGEKRTGAVYCEMIDYIKQGLREGKPGIDLFHGLQALAAENVKGLLQAPRGLDPDTSQRFYSNLDFCCHMLRESGWWSTAWILDPRCFGCPVERSRVWILGLAPQVVEALRMPEAGITEVANQFMELLAIKSHSEMRDLDDFLCDDDHAAVRADMRHDNTRATRELQQRRSGRGSKRKWPDQNATLCDRVGRDWWLSGHPTTEELASYPHLAAMHDREFDTLRLLGVAFPDCKGTVDVGSSSCRTTSRDDVSHIITPIGRFTYNIKIKNK